MFQTNVEEKQVTDGNIIQWMCYACWMTTKAAGTFSEYVILTRSVRKVSDRIFLCEHLMDYNLARLHEQTLNLSAHA